MLASDMKNALISMAFGLAMAGSCLALAFVVFPGSVLTKAFLVPGILIAPLIERLIRSRLVYAIVPEGGPAAAVFLFVGSAFSCWFVLGSAFSSLALRRAKRRSASVA